MSSVSQKTSSCSFKDRIFDIAEPPVVSLQVYTKNNWCPVGSSKFSLTSDPAWRYNGRLELLIHLSFPSKLQFLWIVFGADQLSRGLMELDFDAEIFVLKWRKCS